MRRLTLALVCPAGVWPCGRKGSRRGLVTPTIPEPPGRLRKEPARKGGGQTFDRRPRGFCLPPDLESRQSGQLERPGAHFSFLVAFSEAKAPEGRLHNCGVVWASPASSFKPLLPPAMNWQALRMAGRASVLASPDSDTSEELRLARTPAHSARTGLTEDESVCNYLTYNHSKHAACCVPARRVCRIQPANSAPVCPYSIRMPS